MYIKKVNGSIPLQPISSLAQQVEHWISNPGVIGSIPIRGYLIKKKERKPIEEEDENQDRKIYKLYSKKGRIFIRINKSILYIYIVQLCNIEFFINNYYFL